jgi:hypothetical protein
MDWGQTLNALKFFKEGYKLLSELKSKFQSEKADFVYQKFLKKLAIYENGHGIVINSIEIKVLEKLKELYRFFDATSGNGCKDVSLPSLEKMLKLNHTERFTKAGFWFESDFKCEVRVEEDLPHKKKFIFEWNSQIAKGTIVHLSYAFSIPCLYPLTSGRFDPRKAAEPNNLNALVGFSVNTPIKHFEYEIAFLKSINKEEPYLEVFKGDAPYRKRSKEPEKILDPFYERYRFTLSNLQPGYQINIIWKWRQNKCNFE